MQASSSGPTHMHACMYACLHACLHALGRAGHWGTLQPRASGLGLQLGWELPLEAGREEGEWEGQLGGLEGPEIAWDRPGCCRVQVCGLGEDAQPTWGAGRCGACKGRGRAWPGLAWEGSGTLTESLSPSPEAKGSRPK